MSQNTSAPDHNLYAWPGYIQQNGAYQNSSPLHAKQNGQMNSRPVQRFDSTGTCDQSQDLYSAFSTESSFSYDHPTPGGSINNTAHTPELDFTWQETYDGQVAPIMHDTSYNDGYDGQSTLSFTDQLRSARNSLPSPDSINTATPDASGHSAKPSMNSTIFTSPLSTPLQTKHPWTSLNTEMLEYNQPLENSQTPAPSSSRITSPIIQISRHSRGDSPARTNLDAPRIGKKRSVSNLSQGEYFPDVLGNGQVNMLAPPSRESMQEETANDGAQRSGIDPSQRDDEEINSFEDVEQQQEHEKNVSEVQTWLQQTSLDPSAVRSRRTRVQARPDRLRSRSTGVRPHIVNNPILAAQQIPGPGVTIEEDSEYYYTSDSESSLDPDDHPETLPANVPVKQVMEALPEDQEPLPKQFFRPRPWQDPYATRAPDNSIRYQPDSSNAAMYEFMQRAKNYETASRAATWGTSRRRLSDGDKESIFSGDLKTRHPSLSKRTLERGSSILHKVHEKKEQLIKRSNSHLKRQQYQLHDHPELQPVQSPEPLEERSSSESIKPVRQASYPKPLSPSISAGLLGATHSLTAVGAGSTGLALEADHQHEGLIRRTIRRVRSRSDVNRSPKSPSGPVGITSMIAQQGGMPVPSLASPSQEVAMVSPQQTSRPPTSQPAVVAEEHEAKAVAPVRMALSPQPTNILPTLDGFKLQIRELNPRLEPYLVERIAHDQIRRYKRLVNNKVDHMAAVAEGRCPSGDLCFAMGGEAELLPTRSLGQNIASSSAQFKIAPNADSDNEDSAFDGIVTPAAFPDGIPLPPTKKLPAKFECPLCFQVKSFQKPSDWTKHVHEDVQPFTCTFPNCSEPKSFKRKADWVRHENERHRHLEWWSCNINECTHKCYRKDNFVQHLVREHKRKEPKVKGRGNAAAKGKNKTLLGGFNNEEQDFWNLVDACRHEGATDAKHEPCKFCENNCTTWKKLSVHVGKHMEQIAMPVLDLTRRRNVTKDTVISPVEPPPNRGILYLSQDQNTTGDVYTALSPHTQSGTSNYQSSSASHSPATANRQMGMAPSQALFQTNYIANGIRPDASMTATYVRDGSSVPSGYTNYMSSGNIVPYAPFSGQGMIYPQPQLNPDQFGRRMTGMDGTYMSMNSAFETSPHQAYFSSPELEQTYVYGSNMVPMNANMAMGLQIHTPVTSQPMNANGFVYAAQQQPPNQNQQYSPY